MEEIIEQYSEAKKWKRDMLIAMIAMLAVAAASVVIAFIIKELMALFLIFGGILAVLGAVMYIVSSATFNKADKLIRNYLAANGKSEEEINSILGGAAK